ncbi:SDR family oxidoreductase [candidate division KSB1 bacterium]
MSGKPTILLTGCHGLTGQYIIRSKPDYVYLHGTDIDDISLVHGISYEYHKFDITDRKDVKNIIEALRPEWIINTAAFTDVDECESSKECCWRINVEGLENIIHYVKRTDAKLIHISTDYIFDGKKEIYEPDDLGSPLNYYGKAKLAAENLVKASGLEWTILRTSTLYDVDNLKGRDNFVTWVIKSLQAGEKIKIVNDQWGNPTLARNLAETVWKVIEKNASGVYNAAGSEICDRLSFTREIAGVFDLDSSLIIPVSTGELKQKAVRPLKIGLNVSTTEKDLELEFLSIKKGLTLFKMDYLSMHRVN